MLPLPEAGERLMVAPGAEELMIAWAMDNARCSVLGDLVNGDYLERASRTEDHGGVSLLTAAWERRPRTVDERHVIGLVGGSGAILNRAPAILDLTVGSPVEAVEVDGVAYASAAPAARRLTTYQRRRRPRASQGLLPMMAGPRALAGREVGDVVIATVSDWLGKGDERSPVRADVMRLAALGFATTGIVSLAEDVGAGLLGGAATDANRRRLWDASLALRSLVARVDAIGRWTDLAVVSADPDRGLLTIGPPAWWRGRGEGQAWRLSGGLWRKRIGTADGNRGYGVGYWGGVERTVSGLEARLCWSAPSAGRGRGGRIPDTLRPVRRGGPGPAVFVDWRSVLSLAGEHIKADADPLGTDGRRYRRRVEGLDAAHYLLPDSGGAAPALDTIEIAKVQRGGRAREAGLWIRASAAFVAAHAEREWVRVPVADLAGKDRLPETGGSTGDRGKTVHQSGKDVESRGGA